MRVNPMIQPDFLARFTAHLRDALQKGLAFAIGSGRTSVYPGDILVGILQENGSIAHDILNKAGLKEKDAMDTFRGSPTPHESGQSIAPDLSISVKKLLERAVMKAHKLEHKYIGTEHLLLAMLELSLPDVHAFMTEQGMNIEFAREQLENILKSTSKFSNIPADPQAIQDEADDEDVSSSIGPEERSSPARRLNEPKSTKSLELFARELTKTERVRGLDPVIGREDETERLIEVLCRRTKNNPILLGEPGVGKTAVVEGLAQRMYNGDVPELLQGKRLFAIDLALMVAGTMYRGEFEARLKHMIEEAKLENNVILFIDEIHTIVGAGSSSGSLDAANILKPALARGEIRCIGATTWNEYKKHIEPDAALERRYQVIDVPEPSEAQTKEILQGLKSHYEEHHGVRYTEEALSQAIHLASRYLTDRFFPDKAIDLLDEAAAHVNAKRPISENQQRIHALEIAIEAARMAKEEAVQEGKLKEAAASQEDESRLAEEKAVLEKAKKKHRERLTVTGEEIARVVAKMTHVPISTILATERERLSGLATRLREKIVGQDHVVDAVAESLQRAQLGLHDPRRPKASFLFVGPSGVGKTELAKSLAHELFGKEEALVRLDMTEFAEGHAVSKILGSPAGYVGFREGNKLIDTIRKHPHSVLLFDEFEKAHADVQHLLLQALEEGKLTDGSGKVTSLKHAYIVLTSNVGSEFIHRSSIGFGEESQNDKRFEQSVREQLSDRFRPELLNRLDRVLVFKPLAPENLQTLVARELKTILERVQAAHNISYRVDKQVIAWLVSREHNKDEGARVARHLVEREITGLLSKRLIEEPKKKKWELKIQKDQLVCK